MPTPTKGPYLKLYAKPGRKVVWVIRDKQSWESTGCGVNDRAGAERKLAEYIVRTFRPNTSQGDPAQIQIAEVLALYGRDMAAGSPTRTTAGHHFATLLNFWKERTLADIKGSTCRAYTKWRVEHGRKESTARRELKTLSAAIGHWHRESPLGTVPIVTLPDDGPRRERFLERSEVAALLTSCRRLGHPHVARFILIGLYTGTRHDAILKLGWGQSLAGGYVDLERGILYRRGHGERETSKRRPPLRLQARLVGHLERWASMDRGCRNIVHYHGVPILKMRRAWNTVVREAGLGRDVTPHVLRHTFCCWELWKGRTIWDVAGDMGASPAMVERVYGHHRNPERVDDDVDRRA